MTISALGIACIDCGKPGHIYMVHNRLWEKHTKPKERDRIVCWRCFEKRLGRKLSVRDLTNAPCNLPMPVFMDTLYEKLLNNKQEKDSMSVTANNIQPALALKPEPNCRVTLVIEAKTYERASFVLTAREGKKLNLETLQKILDDMLASISAEIVEDYKNDPA